MNQKNIYGNNFLGYLISMEIIKDISSELIDILKNNNFDFNSKNNAGETIIALIFLQVSKNKMHYNNIIEIVKIDEFDVCNEKNFCKCIYEITDKSHSYNIVSALSKRKDINKFLFESYKDNYSVNIQKEFINIINLLSIFMKDEIIKLFEYYDENHMTIIHLIAKNRHKKLLNYILNRFTFKMNRAKNGLTPLDYFNK